MTKKIKTNDLQNARKAKRVATFQLDTMVLSGVLLLLVFNYLPMIGLVIAFKDYNPNLGIWGSEWCGLDNFKFFFTSQDAVRTIRNTVLYSSSFLILDLVCAVGLALMFYNLRSKKALKFYNTVVILPRFMSPVIIAFIVYILLNPSYGVVNQIIMALGGSKIQWYSQSKVLAGDFVDHPYLADRRHELHHLLCFPDESGRFSSGSSPAGRRQQMAGNMACCNFPSDPGNDYQHHSGHGQPVPGRLRPVLSGSQGCWPAVSHNGCD